MSFYFGQWHIEILAGIGYVFFNRLMQASNGFAVFIAAKVKALVMSRYPALILLETNAMFPGFHFKGWCPHRPYVSDGGDTVR